MNIKIKKTDAHLKRWRAVWLELLCAEFSMKNRLQRGAKQAAHIAFINKDGVSYDILLSITS
jgi:hypothetical protein